ncbi:hypothetical protein KW796_01440 [Candidatus Parcubacteria bacterium]|nr:hypothetical protein [Candidatus Parcubacteria bacterium]
MRFINGYVYVFKKPDGVAYIWGFHPKMLQFSFPDFLPYENVSKARGDIGIKPKLGEPFLEDEAYIGKIDLKIAENEGDEKFLAETGSLVICLRYLRRDRHLVWKFLGAAGRNILLGYRPYQRGRAALKKLGEIRCRGEKPILAYWRLTKVFDLKKDVVTTS